MIDGKVVASSGGPKEAGGSKYRFRGLRPGKYTITAVNFMDMFGWGLDEESAVKRLARAGEPIEIKEGDRIVKDLQVVTKEKLDAK